MADIHLIQSGFLNLCLNKLSQKGVNTSQIIKKCGLHRFNYLDNNAYVPIESIYKLLELFNQKEGIENLAEVIYEPSLSYQISDYVTVMVTKPNFLGFCQFADRFDQTMLTNEKIKLTIKDNRAKVSYIWTDKPSKGRDLMEIYALELAIMAVTFSIGERFVPDEIHFTFSEEPALDRLFPENVNTRIYLNQPEHAIVFPVQLLALGPPSMLNPETMEPVPNTPNSASKKLSMLLDASQSMTLPGLSELSQLLNISTRTLQRVLQKEGTSYFDVIENWRMKAAFELMKDPAISIKEISEKLRYANLSNFNRAFQRWTNSSPSSYRTLIN